MELQQDINIKVLSYNTLIQKWSYTPSVKNDGAWRGFQWRSRLEQLILKMVSQSPDVICLQQIRHVSRYEAPNFYDFYNPLSQMGFEGVFARRNIGGQFGQEGLAIFFNKKQFYLVESKVLYFNDDTGRHALALTLRTNLGTILRVATTHIMYPIQPQKTEKQIKMLQQWQYLHQHGIPCIITGDFNLSQAVTEHYNILKGFNNHFYDTHQKLQCRKGTFSLNLQASNCPGMIPQLMGTKIDYIYATRDFKVIRAQVVGKLQDLPTANEPSDHLPIASTFIIAKNKTTFIDDVRKLQQLLRLTHERNIQDHNFKQFLQIFWLLPKSMQNSIFGLTYKTAVKLGKYENNLQFGRVAFTNNIRHNQTIFDEQGNQKQIYFHPVTNQLIPKQQILNILKIIQQRMVTIPELINKIQSVDIEVFLDIFDQKLSQQICNQVYGEVYRISCEKGLPTHHIDYGKVSFRNIGGWNISNEIRMQALRKLQLP